MRTLDPILESALANQQGELILRVNTWTDAADYIANPTTPDHVWTVKAFTLESTTASAELVTENDYTLSAFTVFTIERGVRLSGVDYTIESGLMHVRKYKEDYGTISITGSSYPNQKINIAAGDGTYQEVIEAFCTAIGKTAVFKNSSDAWLAYQFLPTGKALSLNKAELFENLLKQKYCILVYEESPNSLVFYNQDSYQSSALNALTENAGALLAVATAGANGGMTSTTGADWIPQILPSFYNDVTYAAGLYVAVGASVCATSPDGITWTSRTIPAGTYTSLTFGNSLFVAVGTNVCATSADGITWTRININFWNTSTDIPDVLYFHTASILSDGRILITGGRNATDRVITTYFGTISNNTITWTAGTNLPTKRESHTASILSDGRILITGGIIPDGGSGIVTASTYFGVISGDTITWTAGTAMPTSRYQHAAGILTDGRVLITGGTAAGAPSNITYFGVISGDAITWTAGTVLPAAREDHTASILSDNRVLITGGSNSGSKAETYFGVISGDTITWTAGTTLPAARAKHTIILLANQDIFITGGNNSGTKAETYFGVISGDAITWTAGTVLPAAREDHTASILSDNRVLITGGSNSGSKAETYLSNFPSRVTYGNSLYVSVSQNLCATSTDGATWTQRTIPAGTYYSVTYGNSLFVAVGTSVCATSPDGITWTARTIPAGTYYGVTYGNSLYVAVGASVVATSTDGITWTARTPGASNTWRDVIYSSTLGLFIAVASDGASRTMTSADGITWTASTANADFDLSYEDGPTSYLDRQQSEVHFIWRDEASTVHTSGDTSLPQWNLGFLASTDSPPTTRADAYYKIFLQKAPVRLDITDGDKVHFTPYWSIDPTQTIDAMMQVSEHLNLRASPAWYQEIKSIVLFDKTEGGALPSTIERVAAYTPLVSTGFDGNLTPSVNNLQALAQAVDDLPQSLTTTERNAISTPRAGLTIFNSTTLKLNFYDGTTWRVVTST